MAEMFIFFTTIVEVVLFFVIGFIVPLYFVFKVNDKPVTINRQKRGVEEVSEGWEDARKYIPPAGTTVIVIDKKDDKLSVMFDNVDNAKLVNRSRPNFWHRSRNPLYWIYLPDNLKI